MSAAIERHEQFAARGAHVNEVALVVGGIGRVGSAKSQSRDGRAVQRSRVGDNTPSLALVQSAEETTGRRTDDDLVAVDWVDGEVRLDLTTPGRSTRERPLRIRNRAR